MDTSLTRRQFGKVALAGTATAALSASQVWRAAPAHALVPRAHGPVLTNGYAEWERSVATAAHNLNKVVTGWGGPWRESPDHVWSACTMADFTIVRTHTGDSHSLVDPNTAVAEIRDTRFYDYKAAAKGADKLIIEIGNEPNLGTDVWQYAYNLGATIDALRNAFPGAKLCSPALSPNHGFNPQGWMDNPNWRAQVARCDFVGIHFYTNDPGGDFTRARDYGELNLWDTLGLVSQRWGQPAIATEYSIRGSSLSPYDKGVKYAEVVHFNQSLPDTSRLWGATYFHVQMDPNGDPYQENVGADGAVGYAAKLHG
jgi:hypothetical protein